MSMELLWEETQCALTRCLFVSFLFVQVCEIDARVMQATATKIVPLNGQPAELKTYEVCDPTGQTALTLWNRQIVEVEEGGSYRFTSLATRKEGSRTVLTGTPSTSIELISEVRAHPSFRPVAGQSSRSLRGAVCGVQILAKPRCRRCQGNQDELEPRAKTHRCERCGILQRMDCYNVSYSVVLIISRENGEDSSLTLTNSSVFNYVRDNGLTDIAQDGRAIEEHVMALSDTEVTINGEGLIISFGQLRSFAMSLDSDAPD